MPKHLDLDDPRYAEAAADILYQRQASIHETNITSAVRRFLTLTKLARDEEIVEEQSPAPGSRSAVDLIALDTFIEVKRRIGTAGGGFNPNPDYVAQLDGYLAQSARDGKGVRMGILTGRQVLATPLARCGRGKHGRTVWLHAGEQGRLARPLRMATRMGARL